MLSSKSRDVIVGDLGRIYVSVLCRLRDAHAIEYAHVRVARSSIAGLQMAHLAWSSHGTDRELSVRRIRGTRLRAYLQFSASRVGEITLVGVKAGETESNGRDSSISNKTYKNKRLIRPNRQIVFAYDVSSPGSGQLAQ
jgi:hypothetical protein